jgi:putative ATP-dependent endonuclease of the OLD family
VLQLDSFKVEGFRALTNTDEIPVRSPTILTGGNDGGKSSALDALRFLLDGPRPVEPDYTLIGPPQAGKTEPMRAAKIVVTGLFEEDGELLHIRRAIEPGLQPRYEQFLTVPTQTDLRGLESLKLEELKDRCAARGVEPNGKASAKASWLDPLRELAEKDDQVEEWVDASSELPKRLPRFVGFSSTEEPDPEQQIRSALKVAFDHALDDHSLTGPVREAENRVRQRLSEEASDLCDHIQERCPELSKITVVPDVAFSEGFRSVEIQADRGSTVGVALNRSGAGRRRRINLAVWEWTEKLLEESGDERAVVIAYDEPDTHLDYGHQRKLVNLIQSQCQRGSTRMIIATHSLNLIDRVEISDVVHLRLVDDQTTVERLLAVEHTETERYLADVSAAMGLRNSVLLHERCFLAVEGASETQAIPVLFRLATGISLQSAGIALVAGNSNEGALRVAQFLKEHERRLAFIVDSDSKTGSTRKLFRPDKLEAIGITDAEVFYVGKAEIEDLFTIEQWIAAANDNWPRDDARPWKPDDFAPIAHASKFSSALMNLLRGGSSKAPFKKPAYLFALSRSLKDAEEVPLELRTIFSKLIELANDV